MAYYKKGDTNRARDQLEKAIKLNPDFPGSDEARRVLAGL
jgi:Tfp pilus assembly protein PilF